MKYDLEDHKTNVDMAAGEEAFYERIRARLQDTIAANLNKKISVEIEPRKEK